MHRSARRLRQRPRPASGPPTLLAVVGLALAFLAGACGDDDDNGANGAVRACSSQPPASQSWAGSAEADRATGEADVGAFNRYLENAPAPIGTSPCDAGRVFLHLDRPQGEGVTIDVAVEPEESAEATVTITRENLPDDSVAAERWTLEFEPGPGDSVRLAQAQVTYRCQLGRGQQEFASQLCV